MLGLAQYWMPGWQMPTLPYGVVQVRCRIAGSSTMPLQLLSFSSQISVVGPVAPTQVDVLSVPFTHLYTPGMHVPTLLPHGTSIVHCVGHAENCTPLLTPSSYLPSQSLSM